MKAQAMGIQARSLIKDRIQYALFILFLFVAGITGGIWVSLNYFNDEIAEQEIPRVPMPGRMDRIVSVPGWLDHPFARTENPFLADFRYRASNFDLNNFVFGSAYAALPPPNASYDALRARGMMNADDERLYTDRMTGDSLAFFNQLGKIQSDRAVVEARAELANGGSVDRETLDALRVPGMVLFLAASAATGRPVRAHFNSGTTVRTQATSKDDYRVQLDQQISEIGLFVGSSYDTMDRRRSLSLTQSLGSGWAVGVDRTISNVEPDTQSAVRLQFAAPF